YPASSARSRPIFGGMTAEALSEWGDRQLPSPVPGLPSAGDSGAEPVERVLSVGRGLWLGRLERTSTPFRGGEGAANGMTVAAFAGMRNRPHASIFGRRFSRASSRARERLVQIDVYLWRIPRGGLFR